MAADENNKFCDKLAEQARYSVQVTSFQKMNCSQVRIKMNKLTVKNSLSILLQFFCCCLNRCVILVKVNKQY